MRSSASDSLMRMKSAVNQCASRCLSTITVSYTHLDVYKRQRLRRFALLLVLTGALWLGAWSLPITSIKVGSFLEEQYAVRSMDDLPMTDAIVVLGGNTGGNRQNWFEPELDGSSTHRRVDTAEALYQLGKAPKIIVSGGANEGDISEAVSYTHLDVYKRQTYAHAGFRQAFGKSVA